MFQRLREDYWLYRRRLSERALWAMAVYRFGRWADEIRFAPLRRVAGKLYGALFLFSPYITGVFLDRRTRIGKKFHLVHTGMIIIHPDAVFGDGCGVMHGVTVGVNMNGGVPKFGNDVFIGAHATILGEITIGDGARIAANSLVIGDVPAGALAIGVPARIFRNSASCEKPPVRMERPARTESVPKRESLRREKEVGV